MQFGEGQLFLKCLLKGVLNASLKRTETIRIQNHRPLDKGLLNCFHFLKFWGDYMVFIEMNLNLLLHERS